MARVLSAKEGDEGASDADNLEDDDGALVQGGVLPGTEDEYDDEDSFLNDGSMDYVSDLEDSM